ncbi:MAG: hypothetical protein A2X61_02285 [Ignavibacteria bacterium GWB2_35_12]|nr:MAG: hypothetical protein A2X63_00220 [Ignavibacteria bacterium GWA2_35_8]OGU42214.1 MAG: hypothetical protein A2X61_02285 [Ignavibacteria bacterium GWB2_35_12]OGU96818.1 MAG: hypothetical protein A2220_00835 [Ignavibacteria bacterium RIFOXYA2_FULL_35_10]OGV18818.1 MAG: hypothetical protein A2475_08760 [Ignavibacteria bacterium RIFOXYC2_FULL_35_21]
MKFKLLYIVIILSFVFFLKLIVGCGTEVIGPNTNIIFPDSLVSYISNVEPFMRVKCAYSGCHSDPPYNSASTMTNYFSLFSTDNLGLVIAKKPDNSVLIQILDGRLPHNPYFQEGYITQNQINGMRKWIEEGAKNN